jgi:PAS domain S-box-containing protein
MNFENPNITSSYQPKILKSIFKRNKVEPESEVVSQSQLLYINELISYFIINQEGFIIEANKKFCEKTGIPFIHKENINFYDFLDENDAKILKQALSSTPLQSSTIQLFVKLNTLQNIKLPCQIKGQYLNENSTEKKILFIFNDLTDNIKIEKELQAQQPIDNDLEAKLLEKELELQNFIKTYTEQQKNIDDLQIRIIENEMRLKLAFNDIDDGVWDWNIKADRIFFSDKFFTMLGFDAYEFSHNLESWKNLIHPDDFEATLHLFTLISQGLITEFSTEYRMRRKIGDYIWMLSRAHQVEKDENGKPIQIIGIQVDITKQKEIELSLKSHKEKLEKQNEEYAKLNNKLTESNRKISKFNKQLQDKQAYLNSIFKTVPACIGLISDGIILFANEYTALTTGYEIDEIIGNNTRIVYPNDKEYQKVYETLYKNNTNGHTKSLTTKWKTKNGTILDIYITATRLESDEGHLNFTFTALDITSQRIYEDELIQAKEQAEKAERLKTVFLSNMSHELRTPMNGIVGFAEMLQSQVNQSKKDQYLKVIVNSSKQLLKIISDIIDISKIETGEVETFYTSFSINSLMKEFYEFYLNYLASRNKSAIKLEYNCNVPQNQDIIFTDENKVRQVLTNLLANAVKFTDEGKIGFGCSVKNKLIEFFVRDTGIGVEESEKEVIFESFRQTESPIRKKYGGNGLGLAIAKGLLNSISGAISFNSEIEKGSTFYFTIPLQFEESEIEEEVIINLEPYKIWEKYHILVVEDDLTCYTLIEEMLEETGIKITHAITGLEAVKFCRKDTSIDLVLMDMRLPEIDGYEATKRIKEFRPNLAIIAQTAHALSEDRNKCMAAGCNNYMTKPVNQDLLFSTIGEFLKN